MYREVELINNKTSNMNILTIYFNLFFLLFFNLSNAQNSVDLSASDYPTLNEKVGHSDLVIEGEVINTKSFRNNGGNIYTAVNIRVTKIFKGAINDSMIELILQEGGTDSMIVVVSNKLSLEKGMEGIFLLSNNGTKVSLNNAFQSYVPLYGVRSYIEYHDRIHMFAHHIATCRGVAYDDLENDLFKPIEALTGVPRKVLGLNMFERKVIDALSDKKN